MPTSRYAIYAPPEWEIAERAVAAQRKLYSGLGFRAAES